MLTLRGAPAVSAFRLDKLVQIFQAIHPDISLLHTEYLHFAEVDAELSEQDRGVLASLLTYGPAATEVGLPEDAELLAGIISQMSSKAGSRVGSGPSTPVTSPNFGSFGPELTGHSYGPPSIPSVHEMVLQCS